MFMSCLFPRTHWIPQPPEINQRSHKPLLNHSLIPCFTNLRSPVESSSLIQPNSENNSLLTKTLIIANLSTLFKTVMPPGFAPLRNNRKGILCILYFGDRRNKRIKISHAQSLSQFQRDADGGWVFENSLLPTTVTELSPELSAYLERYLEWLSIDHHEPLPTAPLFPTEAVVLTLQASTFTSARSGCLSLPAGGHAWSAL